MFVINFPRLSYNESLDFCVNPFSFNTVVDIRFMQTAYTTSETLGSVSVCVDISSAHLARNVSVTLRSVSAGQAVGKLFKSRAQKSHYAYDEIITYLHYIRICPVNAHLSCFHFLLSIAVDDYVPATIEVQFQMAPDTVCHSFTILEDTEVEPVETFGVLLETSDPAVRLTDIFATVSINDSTGISSIVCNNYDTVKYFWLLTDNSNTPLHDG